MLNRSYSFPFPLSCLNFHAMFLTAAIFAQPTFDAASRTAMQSKLTPLAPLPA